MSDGQSTADGSSGSSGRDVRRAVFVVFALLTVVGIVASMRILARPIPPRIYLFGFLGSTVYVFTSLARKFDRENRYALEVASKAVAAFPLSAGVYLLAFSFPGVGGSAPTAERLTSGLAFLAGAYVSLTLRALGGLAHRMLGVRRGSEPPSSSRAAREGETDASNGAARAGDSGGESTG